MLDLFPTLNEDPMGQLLGHQIIIIVIIFLIIIINIMCPVTLAFKF